MTASSRLFLAAFPFLLTKSSHSFWAIPVRTYRHFFTTISLKSSDGMFCVSSHTVSRRVLNFFNFSTLESTMSSPFTTSLVDIDKPVDQNCIIGTTHFIKTVDDIHEGEKFLMICTRRGAKTVCPQLSPFKQHL
jgi:hypothetical protein